MANEIEEFFRRIGDPRKPNATVAPPNELEWRHGKVVELQVAYVTRRGSFQHGDIVLMEAGCADRFISKGYAVEETKEQRKAAIEAGFARGTSKSAKPKSKESKSEAEE